MSIQVIMFVSFILVSIFGVLLHYTHQWLKKGLFTHIFSAINESTWEHTKLSFYPLVITLAVHYFIPTISYEGFIGAAFIVSLLSVVIIPFFYYPLRILIGREITFVSISLYFISVAICLLLEYHFVINKIYILSDVVGIVGIIFLFLIFAYFTYFPPRIFLFKDPIYRKFGEFKQKFDK